MMVCVLCKSSRVGKVTGHDSLLITIRLKVSILITRLSSAQLGLHLVLTGPAGRTGQVWSGFVIFVYCRDNSYALRDRSESEEDK